MTTKLTYNQFRSAHKGTPRKEISNLWNLYKEGEYTFPPEEETQPQEPITETPVETVAPIEKVPEKSASMDELCKEFDHLRTKMSKFTFRFSKEAKEAGRKRMMEIAKLTIPKGLHLLSYRLLEDLVRSDLHLPTHQHNQHDGIPSDS